MCVLLLGSWFDELSASPADLAGDLTHVRICVRAVRRRAQVEG